jgi:hypothetical protein
VREGLTKRSKDSSDMFDQISKDVISYKSTVVQPNKEKVQDSANEKSPLAAQHIKMFLVIILVICIFFSLRFFYKFIKISIWKINIIDKSIICKIDYKKGKNLF